MIEILPWLYVALAVAFLAAGLRPSVRGTHLLVQCLFTAALGAHLTHFVGRWILNGHAPLQSKHELFLATGLATMIFALALYLTERIWRDRGGGNVVFALLTAGGGFVWTTLAAGEDAKVRDLVPALQSVWHQPHVGAYVLGCGALGLAALLALAYVIGVVGVRLAGAESPLRHLASPLVERWTYKVAGLGFPFLTAALCLGALWADSLWGETWFWDVKEIWSLIPWTLFLIYFHLRLAGWSGLKTQLLVIGGGAMIWISYMMIHVLPASQGSLHVYN